MSVPKFKRKPSDLDYVDNAYNLQVEIMNLWCKGIERIQSNNKKHPFKTYLNIFGKSKVNNGIFN